MRTDLVFYMDIVTTESGQHRVSYFSVAVKDRVSFWKDHPNAKMISEKDFRAKAVEAQKKAIADTPKVVSLWKRFVNLFFKLVIPYKNERQN
jgi:hypothetical protein